MSKNAPVLRKLAAYFKSSTARDALTEAEYAAPATSSPSHQKTRLQSRGGRKT